MPPLAGIQDLGCIGECMNLERLDLTGNNITNLAALSSLRHLSVLNLSANKISSLGGLSGHTASIDSISVFVWGAHTRAFRFAHPEPLRSCESLQNLNVAGNIISR